MAARGQNLIWWKFGDPHARWLICVRAKLGQVTHEQMSLAFQEKDGVGK
jgi:hypothetical protein